MKRKTTTASVLAVLLVGTFWMAAGCKKKPPTTVPEAQPGETSETPTRVQPPAPPAPSGDVTAGPLEGSLDDINKRGLLRDAFFDYDQYELRDEAREALSANADFLKQNTSVQVLIEGHCDERGTNDYNLALGDRRANAAREYLASLGVDGSRMRTVSYGEERPACTASTEECWQQNRRAHFVITAK